jgi:4a-hydroxytetrahydrobiopterin dehydratase
MQIQDLASRDCKTFEGGEPPLGQAEQKELADQLAPGWRIVEGHHLEKEYEFEDFREALDFTNEVGEIAEEQDHHPDIELGWGRVLIRLRTHKIDGLSENDFILAAKADEAMLDG